MRLYGGRSLAAALAAGVVMLAWGAAASQDLDAPPPGTPSGRSGGAEPIPEADYAQIQKVRRHRAWLPPSVDLSSRFPTPGDQQWQGACVSWATGYAARSFLTSAALGRAPQSRAEEISPQYIHNKVRNGPLKACWAGAKLPDALNLLQNEGAVTLAQWPYGQDTCQKEPPESLKPLAAKFRIKAWRAIDHETPDNWQTPLVLDDVKGALAQGLPVVFIMHSPKSFYVLKNFTGVYRFLPGDDLGKDYHAMALVGYDDQRQAVRVINSWGVDWADGGYGWIDYDTFKHLVTEAYVMEPFADAAGPLSPLALAVAARAQSAGGPDAGLAALAANPGCGRLQLRKENGRRVMDGYGGVDKELAFLKDKAMGLDPNLDWRVVTHPWPQCEAEQTLQKEVDVGQVKVTIADDRGGALAGDPVRLQNNQLFSISVETNAARPFVHVIYLQADGSAVELYRAAPPIGPDGRRRVIIGADGAKAVRFQVSEPFGDEEIIALNATGPLFDERLGPHVTERQFLTMLRARLVQAGKDGTVIGSAITRIRTSAN